MKLPCQILSAYFLFIYLFIFLHPSNNQHKINIFLTLNTCWDLLLNTLYIPGEEQFYANNQIKEERCGQSYLIICEFFKNIGSMSMAYAVAGEYFCLNSTEYTFVLQA